MNCTQLLAKSGCKSRPRNLSINYKVIYNQNECLFGTLCIGFMHLIHSKDKEHFWSIILQSKHVCSECVRTSIWMVAESQWLWCDEGATAIASVRHTFRYKKHHAESVILYTIIANWGFSGSLWRSRTFINTSKCFSLK